MDLPLPTLPFRLYCPRHAIDYLAQSAGGDMRKAIGNLEFAVTSYKGKAEGSNSSEGLWIANLTGEPLDKASEIVWFESAYDAMAEYQINPVKMVYVSTGGTPTEGQMRGLLSVTPNARHYLGFDKDDAGRQFVANFRKVAAEMGFRHEHVQAYHPLGCYKDWNDALLNKKSAELIAKGEPDTFDYAEFIAAGKAEKQREKEEKNTYHRSV